MVGTTISHYKVLEKVGEGGMGEVYRATDTKLNRDVALRILLEQFTSDSQRNGPVSTRSGGPGLPGSSQHGADFECPTSLG